MKAHGGGNLWEKPTASGAKWWMTLLPLGKPRTTENMLS